MRVRPGTLNQKSYERRFGDDKVGGVTGKLHGQCGCEERPSATIEYDSCVWQRFLNETKQK